MGCRGQAPVSGVSSIPLSSPLLAPNMSPDSGGQGPLLVRCMPPRVGTGGGVACAPISGPTRHPGTQNAGLCPQPMQLILRSTDILLPWSTIELGKATVRAKTGLLVRCQCAFVKGAGACGKLKSLTLAVTNLFWTWGWLLLYI